ncbi:chaperone-binding protein [Grosmannia clavigera kw1407]|uniref:Chaperone-binding protein n=1 Tax=Grosmannia clavigera (strain kw1407 / UAMH 11150) TaxID=655863 RepID=F0XIL1_GROCL|nr:chaperone-binding protein [Grosmannia clavigera kw1407]EFX02547.1 chaperone-binding protein [Grosmannia clavigera kw1407]
MFEFEINAEHIPLYKLVLHILQLVLSFVCWCLEIAVFRSKNATVNGQCGWAFGVCFLSAPAWLYLIGAPRFPRTRRFAEPHVMVAVDAIFCIIWLSAFAAQAAYNTADKCGEGCRLSKAIVALGVINTYVSFSFVLLSSLLCSPPASLLFGITTFVSLYTLKYYQLNGQLPGYDRLGGPKNVQNIDPDMAAFSAAPMGEEPYARLNDMDNDHDHDNDNEEYRSDLGGGYGGASSQLDTSYGGASSQLGTSYGNPDNTYGSYLDPIQRPYAGGSSISGVSTGDPFDDGRTMATSALRPAASAASLSSVGAPSSYMSPTVHDAYDDDHGRPVRFPEADYDRN